MNKISETMRSFIAAPLNQEIRAEIQRIETQLKKLNCDVKWVEPSHAHLTLKFLGDVPPAKLDSIKKYVENIAQKTPAIHTRLTYLGAFPKIEHPQVIWIGLKDDQKHMEQLARVLEENLAFIGFKKENRPFQSHITLGRLRSSKNAHLLTQEIKNLIWPRRF